jgi:dTDP-4-amino-4,6-dideoxygalactose transaminase
MAVGVDSDCEVIVSPYTMSATAAAPKILGAKIVFADIEDETFCLDPVEVANAITDRTKAVIVTNLFGHPARLHELKQICDDNGVYLIEDNAQAIFAKENDKYTGTIGDIGVFSLNVHKQIQTGEGGVCVTDTTELAIKLREAMNHGEMRGGILGLNLRMTEVTAAMAIEQLRKAEKVIGDIRSFAEGITHYVDQLGLQVVAPEVRAGCVHSYYCWAGKIALPGEVNVVPPFSMGYMRPLYELPAFKQDIKLPVVEFVENNMILLEMCELSSPAPDIEQMIGRLRRAA